MFDFFTDNPVLVLVIIFVIVRLLRGDKNRAKKPAPRAVESKAAGGERSRSTRLAGLRAVLEEATREADRQLPAGGISTPADVDALPVSGQSLPLPSPADPFAFHSLMNREKERVADSSRIDYDTAAVDYDTRPDAFAFRSSSNGPVDREYHLTGFAGFKRAGGLATDPVRVQAVGEDAKVERERDPLQIALADPDQLRRAIVLHEILERPVSLRRR